MTLWDELIDAFLDSDIDHRYALDLVQGVVALDWDELVTGGPSIDWEDPASEERYCAIPQCRTHDAYACRERFAVRDASGRLSDSLNRSRPFRRFKDALTDLELWETWNAFERAWAQGELEPWVAALPIPYDVLAGRHRNYWEAQERLGFQ